VGFLRTINGSLPITYPNGTPVLEKVYRGHSEEWCGDDGALSGNSPQTRVRPIPLPPPPPPPAGFVGIYQAQPAAECDVPDMSPPPAYEEGTLSQSDAAPNQVTLEDCAAARKEVVATTLVFEGLESPQKEACTIDLHRVDDELERMRSEKSARSRSSSVRTLSPRSGSVGRKHRASLPSTGSAEEDFSSFRTPDGAWKAEEDVAMAEQRFSPKAPRSSDRNNRSSVDSIGSIGSNASRGSLGRLARLEQRISALGAASSHEHGGEWFELIDQWAKGLDQVQNLQQFVNRRRVVLGESTEWITGDGFIGSMGGAGWVRRLCKAWPDRFHTPEGLVLLLMPALEMVKAMALCTTPVQKVRLWTEAILEASSLISLQLPNGDPLGGDDLPSLVLFLVCHAECDDIAAQVQVASLFLMDPHGRDKEDYALHYKGLCSDCSSQYVFDAERRCVDPWHYFMWVYDALEILKEAELAEAPH